MKVRQLDVFLEAMEKLLAIKWKGTRAKQIPVHCMKRSARREAVVCITQQNVVKTEMIKYISLCGHVAGVPEGTVSVSRPQPPGATGRPLFAAHWWHWCWSWRGLACDAAVVNPRPLQKHCFCSPASPPAPLSIPRAWPPSSSGMGEGTGRGGWIKR